MKINLPARIEVMDYHEFDSLLEALKQIIPGIKVKEIGCVGNYIGIAYVGNLQEIKNKKLFKAIKEETKEEY